MIATTLDGDISKLNGDKKLVWMPAHQTVSRIGTARKSDGTLLTAREWRANQLVDGLAKIEAQKGAACSSTVDLLTSATVLARFAAAQLGVATFAANNHIIQVTRDDGTVHGKTLRDAQQPPKVYTQGQKHRCQGRSRGRGA